MKKLYFKNLFYLGTELNLVCDPNKHKIKKNSDVTGRMLPKRKISYTLILWNGLLTKHKIKKFLIPWDNC